jgi:hypothetical protein
MMHEILQSKAVQSRTGTWLLDPSPPKFVTKDPTMTIEEAALAPECKI